MKIHNISFIRILTIIIVVLVPGVARATDYDGIVASLLGSDAQVELSQKQADAAMTALVTENVLPDAEAEVEYLRSGSGEEKFNLSVSQSFDWPGLYGARGERIALEQEGVRLEHESLLNEHRLKLRLLLIDIIAANRMVGQLTKAVEGCNRLLATLEDDYSRGEVSILAVNKMRIELADFKLKLSEASTTRTSLIGELVELSAANDDVISQCVALEEFPLIEMKELSRYVEEAKAEDGAMRMARNAALVAKARKKEASRSTLPGFSAGYRLSHEDGELFNGFTVGVSVPLWRASKERRAASAAEVSAMFGERVEEVKLEKGVEATYHKAEMLKGTIAEYGKALTVSDNAGLLRRAYESGAITLTEYVYDINYFVEAMVQHTELQRQYYNALVELSRYEARVE